MHKLTGAALLVIRNGVRQRRRQAALLEVCVRFQPVADGGSTFRDQESAGRGTYSDKVQAGRAVLLAV